MNIRRAIEAGAVDFFRKPLDAKAFLAAIQSVLRPSRCALKHNVTDESVTEDYND
jgi:FixJ family two-component response regulator